MVQTFENTYGKQNLKSMLLEAFNTVEEVLIPHSGPFATNAVIGSTRKQVNDVDEFTKDGINILTHVVVDEDPGARFAVRLARFVGIAVDNRCHDGTTTSMLMACALAKIALAKMDTDLYDADRYVWMNRLTKILDKCLDDIDALRVTDEDILERCKYYGIETTPADIRGAIAYHMASISSKGDYDLAEKIALIVKSSPKKIYSMYRNIPLAVETKEPYTLKRQSHDLLIGANLVNVNDYNYKNDTQYLSENAVIFATGNGIVTDSMEAGFLSALISTKKTVRNDLAMFGVEKGWEDLHEDKYNLIIMAPMINDYTLTTIVNEFNRENPKVKISMFITQINPQVRTTFYKTLHYMAGVPIFEDVMLKDATRSMIGLNGRPARVHLLGSFFSISNLYERDGETFHPYYRDPDAFPDYTRFREETEELIRFGQENVTNPALNHDDFTHIMSLYRSMTSQFIYDIEVGGSKHDQLANRTVYEDSIGAALSAVDHGVVLGGYAHLAKNFADYHTDIGEMFYNAFKDIVFDSLRIADRSNEHDLFNHLRDDKWSYMIANKSSYGIGVAPKDYIDYRTLNKAGLEAFLKCSPDHPVLLQAYAGYEEQFNRFHDLLTKLANTTLYIDMRAKHDSGA